MTKESVVKFFEMVQQNAKLAEQLRPLGENVEEFSRLAIELGRKHGFEFEATDVRDALAELNDPQATLTEEQLQEVAGGGITAINPKITRPSNQLLTKGNQALTKGVPNLTTSATVTKR
jgi:predicted ribosomally synthesized peptide with nif11-like leader